MELYAVDVSALSLREDAALALLSPSRREKALRYQRGLPRLLSIGAGLLLRRYVGDAPIILSPGGKPRMEGAPCFNLSHSGTLAVLAVAEGEVGADIECVGAVRPAILPRVFTAEERALIGEDGAVFTRLWTRKEAVLKCCGCGIDRAMNGFSVLGDTVSLDGVRYFLSTLPYRNAMLSAAVTEGDPRFRVTEVPLGELLR